MPDDAQSQLRDALARCYDTLEPTTRRVMEAVGLKPEAVDRNGAGRNVWFLIVEEASKQQRIEALRAFARSEYPREPAFGGAPPCAPTFVAAGTLDIKRRQSLVLRLAAAYDATRARAYARERGLTVPETRDAGEAWVAVVQELTLRGDDLGPLLAMAPET